MAVNLETNELGKLLGQNIANFNQYRSDFVESEEVSDLDLYYTGSIELTGIWTVSSWALSPSVFMLDHPVYGILDKTVLVLSGAHLGASALVSSGVL
jgi:hypothetical protein